MGKRKAAADVVRRMIWKLSTWGGIQRRKGEENTRGVQSSLEQQEPSWWSLQLKPEQSTMGQTGLESWQKNITVFKI